jgi:hypothetical protein
VAGGAGAALVALAATPAGTGAQGLRAGVVYEGTIRVDGNTVSLLIGGQALSLKTALSFINGQRVQAQLVRTPEGMQARITLAGGETAAGARPGAQPLPNAPNAPNAPSAPAATTNAAQLAQLSRMAAEVARTMPQGLDAGRLGQLLPRQMPPTDGLVRAAMQVLATREAAGADLAAIGKVFAAAAERGVIPATTAGFVLAFQVTDGDQPEAWLRAIQRWVEAASKPLEARLAAALRGGAAADKPLDLGQELRSVLMQARGDEGLARSIQREGGLDAFRQALDRAVDRLTGAQAQNLRAFDGPYLFAELPGGERFQRAHLHVLGDGGKGKQGGGQRQVVLDVSLRRLGELWLALSVSGPRCQCTVRVADPAILPELTEASADLEASLREAGFPAAEVRVLGWDGDRVAALASVLAIQDRLDLEA